MPASESLTASAHVSDTWTFEPFLSGWVLVILALAMGAGLAWEFMRRPSPLNPIQCLCLLGLRACAVLSVLLCLARPVHVKTNSYREKGVLYAALDSSSSMAMRDMPGGKSRWDA